MPRKGGVPENLKPAKKGEPSRNPKGRPKGLRNRATLIKKWIEVSENVKNQITGEKQMLTQADIMTIALIKKAKTGDVQAFRELMDGAFGKIKTEIEHDISETKLPNVIVELK